MSRKKQSGLLIHPTLGKFCYANHLETMIGQVERKKNSTNRSGKEKDVKGHFWAYRNGVWHYATSVRFLALAIRLQDRTDYQYALYRLYAHSHEGKFPEGETITDELWDDFCKLSDPFTVGTEVAQTEQLVC